MCSTPQNSPKHSHNNLCFFSHTVTMQCDCWMDAVLQDGGSLFLQELLPPAYSPTGSSIAMIQIINFFADHWYVHICTCHIRYTSHVYDLIFLLEGMTVELKSESLPSQWPQLETVSTFVNMTTLDIFQDTTFHLCKCWLILSMGGCNISSCCDQNRYLNPKHDLSLTITMR